MATTSVPSCATGCACSFSRQTLHARVPGPLWISIVIMPCYVAVTLVPLTSNFGTAWCSSPRESFFARRGSVMLWTSSVSLAMVNPTIAWTWSVFHMHAMVRETLLVLFQLLSMLLSPWARG